MMPKMPLILSVLPLRTRDVRLAHPERILELLAPGVDDAQVAAARVSTLYTICHQFLILAKASVSLVLSGITAQAVGWKITLRYPAPINCPSLSPGQID